MAWEQWPADKHKTCRRYNDPGHAHSLTFSCFHGTAFLSKDRTCEWLVDAIGVARQQFHFDLWAYVIMPEHCHVVLYPREADYSISRILEAIKLPVTRRAKSYLERTAPESLRLMRDEQPNGKVSYRFWQRGGGHDRNLMEPEAIHAEIEYIHANPVRRELATRPEDWRWSSAAWYAGASDVPLVPDAASLRFRAWDRRDRWFGWHAVTPRKRRVGMSPRLRLAARVAAEEARRPDAAHRDTMPPSLPPERALFGMSQCHARSPLD